MEMNEWLLQNDWSELRDTHVKEVYGCETPQAPGGGAEDLRSYLNHISKAL